MSRWIKPSQLSAEFWGECFVAICNEGEIFVEINYVKVQNNRAHWFLEEEKEWITFNSEESCILVQPIEYPKVKVEDF